MAVCSGCSIGAFVFVKNDIGLFPFLQWSYYEKSSLQWAYGRYWVTDYSIGHLLPENACTCLSTTYRGILDDLPALHFVLTFWHRLANILAFELAVLPAPVGIHILSMPLACVVATPAIRFAAGAVLQLVRDCTVSRQGPAHSHNPFAAKSSTSISTS